MKIVRSALLTNISTVMKGTVTEKKERFVLIRVKREKMDDDTMVYTFLVHRVSYVYVWVCMWRI